MHERKKKEVRHVLRTEVVLRLVGHWVQLPLHDSEEPNPLVERFSPKVGRASSDMLHRPILQPQAEVRTVE